MQKFYVVFWVYGKSGESKSVHFVEVESRHIEAAKENSEKLRQDIQSLNPAIKKCEVNGIYQSVPPRYAGNRFLAKETFLSNMTPSNIESYATA